MTAPIERQVVRELVEGKAPLVMNDLLEAGQGWKVHYALFSHRGFTPAACSKMERQTGLLIDLPDIDRLPAGTCKRLSSCKGFRATRR